MAASSESLRQPPPQAGGLNGPDSGFLALLDEVGRQTARLESLPDQARLLTELLEVARESLRLAATLATLAVAVGEIDDDGH